MTTVHGGISISKPLPLITALLEYAAKERIPFHTPGHKGGRGLAPVLREQVLEKMDLTELPGLDDLHQPSGVIAESQASCASRYGAMATYFLVNGASVGIEAAMMSVLGPDQPVLVPRNAHKSVYSALILSGARPVYYLPEVHPEFGLALGQDPEKMLCLAGIANLNTAVTLYPTYFGTTWALDLFRLKFQGTIIADEAHGAHLAFSPSLPTSALALGADLVVQSTHKTLGAFTQGALLHINKNSLVSRQSVSGALDVLQTTSPSYLIMASLESAVWDAGDRGGAHWSTLVERAVQLKRKLTDRGLRVLDESDIGSHGIAGLDHTKLLLHTPGQAAEVASELTERWGVQPELWDRDNILFLLGMGDSEGSMDRLEQALTSVRVKEFTPGQNFFWPVLPTPILTPREAYFSPKVLVPLEKAVGRICAQTVSAYPPGIPLIAPGEIIAAEHCAYITESLDAGVHWQGLEVKRANQILVIEEKL